MIINKIKNAINLMRPKQYIKNLFVFSALIFSENILNKIAVGNTLIAFISFCFISSAVYVLNDIVDIEKDKIHPKKCKRPLASGKIKVSEAYILFICLIIISILFSLAINKRLSFIIILYLFNNILYSFKLKNIILLDVFSISIGFVLRVISGAVSIEVPISNWIILCTFFLSLYLGLGKRKKEISLLKNKADEHRKILKEYNEDYINQCINVVQSCTITCYALYSASHIENNSMILTTIFVIYGLLRYNYIICTEEDGNPTDIVLKDISLIVNVILWIISCIYILI